ncbi:hypothetical protein COBT_003617, partial [Conglomerata obtusa]
MFWKNSYIKKSYIKTSGDSRKDGNYNVISSAAPSDSEKEHRKIPKFSNNTINIYRYSGSKDESLKDWLRQFRHFMRLYEGYTEHNLQYYASSYLVGDAGRYYDDITPEPKKWSEFVCCMEARFGEPVLDKPGLYRKILSRFQKEDENTKNFCQELYKLAEKAGMEEDLIVQTIIANMKEKNRILYRLHVNEDFTYKKLLKLIDIIEFDHENINYNSRENTNDEKDQIAEIVDKLDMLTLTIKNNQNKIKKHTRVQVKCTKCNRNGHSSYDCYSNHSHIQNHSNHQLKTENVMSKLKSVCALLKERISGDLESFKKKIKNPSKTLENLFKSLPSNLDAFDTLKKNEFLLDEIIKCLETKTKINNVNSRNKVLTNHYDAISAILKIENYEIKSTIDTGACLTIISDTLADKLAQPIEINHRTPLTMANNQVTYSSGIIKNLPIKFDDVVFPVDALILKDAAQDLLIGTN